jgi:YVTN family beta-propeller protein
MTVARCTVSALLVGLALSTQTKAKDTGYVFVSNEKTNDVTVIDPRQEDRVIKWIHTSHRPRGMSWQNDRQQLLVACGDDAVIDVIDVATLAVTDHIPTGADPEMFELSQDQKTLYVPTRQDPLSRSSVSRRKSLSGRFQLAPSRWLSSIAPPTR